MTPTFDNDCHPHSHDNHGENKQLLEAIRLLHKLIRKVEKLKMSNDELLQAVSDIADQLAKALAEILAEIQALGTVPQAIVDKVAAVKATAQQLDDLNPDVPPVP